MAEINYANAIILSMATANKKSAKITRKRIWFAVLYILIICIGLAFANYFWISAGIAKCGVYGCASPYSDPYNSHGVQLGLYLSGIVTAISVIIVYFISKRKWWWLIIAGLLLITTPIIGANRLGVDFYGNPIDTGGLAPNRMME